MKIIMLEFNELCPSIVSTLIDEGRLPNFRRLRDSSQVFTALADECEDEKLEPWIQWYSIHTGLPFSTHGVFHLTDGPTAGHSDIWSILINEGRNVGNCGSMNAAAFNKPGSFFIPDPWCTTERTCPATLNKYQHWITALVQDNSTGGLGGLSLADHFRFLTVMLSHGLSFATIFAILRQLIDDKLWKKGEEWKRPVLLDKLQLDLFVNLWKKNKPDFSTFFLNSTAHFQHAYWHYYFPNAIPELIVEDRAKTLRDAIPFGYEQMDGILGRILELTMKEDVRIILSTALSQHTNPKGGYVYHRPRDINLFLCELGIEYDNVQAVMAEQFSIHFQSEAAMQSAHDKLSSLKIAGQPVIAFGKSVENTLFIGSAVRHKVPDSALIENFPKGARKFYDIYAVLPHTKAATHDVESILWIQSEKPNVHDYKPSILDILPTILELLNAKANDSAHVGQSLVPKFKLA